MDPLTRCVFSFLQKEPRVWQKKKPLPEKGRGLEIRMGYQKKQLLQALGQMLLRLSTLLCRSPKSQ